MTPFEIVKRTPKNNCRKCGYPTCLAFSAAVAKSGEDLGKCPYLDTTGLNVLQPPGVALEELSGQRDQVLIEHLKNKISTLDFSRIAAPLGASLRGENNQALSFLFLAQEIFLDKQGILLDGQPPDDPRDQILLYNYIHSQGGPDPTLDWIGLETLPNSISKVRTLATYCENRLAELRRNNHGRLPGVRRDPASDSFRDARLHYPGSAQNSAISCLLGIGAGRRISRKGQDAFRPPGAQFPRPGIPDLFSGTSGGSIRPRACLSKPAPLLKATLPCDQLMTFRQIPVILRSLK